MFQRVCNSISLWYIYFSVNDIIRSVGRVTLPLTPLGNRVLRQIQPTKHIPEFEGKGVRRFLICSKSQHTARITCKQFYCFECDRQHLLDLLEHHSKYVTSSESQSQEQVIVPPANAPWNQSAYPSYSKMILIHPRMSSNISHGRSQE